MKCDTFINNLQHNFIQAFNVPFDTQIQKKLIKLVCD